MAGPRFFGFVIGGSLPVTLAANWLAGAWDQNTALYRVTPATSHLEQLALAWLLELFGLPPECGGRVRHRSHGGEPVRARRGTARGVPRAGWDVEATGSSARHPSTSSMGDEGHPSVFKSLGLLGLGRGRVHRVPVDGQGRMRPDLLPEMTGRRSCASRRAT